MHFLLKATIVCKWNPLVLMLSTFTILIHKYYVKAAMQKTENTTTSTSSISFYTSTTNWKLLSLIVFALWILLDTRFIPRLYHSASLYHWNVTWHLAVTVSGERLFQVINHFEISERVVDKSAGMRKDNNSTAFIKDESKCLPFVTLTQTTNIWNAGVISVVELKIKWAQTKHCWTSLFNSWDIQA